MCYKKYMDNRNRCSSVLGCNDFKNSITSERYSCGFFTMSLPLGWHKNVTMWKVTTFLLVWLCSSQRIMGRPMLPCVTVKIVIKAMRALSQIGQWSDFVGAVKTRRRSLRTKDIYKDINLAPVLQRADIDFHQINLYPVDSAIFCFC